MPRVGFPGGPRLDWYDRNPGNQRQLYAVAGVAPHLETIRWTYTVPAAKKAWISAAFVAARRATAATTAGEVRARVVFAPSGGQYGSIIMARIFGNVVNDQDKAAFGPGMMMQATDQLLGLTMDLSTGGTIDYEVTAVIVEFGA